MPALVPFAYHTRSDAANLSRSCGTHVSLAPDRWSPGKYVVKKTLVLYKVLGGTVSQHLRNTKGYSSTYLAMGFANVRAGTWDPPEH